MIIGLMGKAGAGKTTSAEMLDEILGGARVISIAAPIKSMLLGMGLQPVDFDRKHKEKPVGWVGASPRQLMQSLGDWGRGVNQSLWVQLAESRVLQAQLAGDANIIIDDIRMPLEAALIRKFNGMLIRITRPGFNASSHTTERDLIEADHTIHNAGTPDQLRQALEDVIQEFL